MPEYINSVLVASGVDEVLETQDAEVLAVDKQEDPCWDGYEQIGMKEKDGKRVPNCVPSAAAIDHMIDGINSQFGDSRRISKESAYAVARKACDKYSYLADEDLFSAVMWELHVFAEYATSGTLDVEEDFSDYSENLPAGHPDTEASLTAAAAWIAGAPELNNSGREALLQAFSEDSDYVKTLHASTRVRAMVSGGSLTDATLSQIKNLSDRYSKVNQTVLG